MSSLIEKVSKIIKERKGATISHSRIEEAIKNKKDKIMVHGAKINFNEIMNLAAKESSKIAIESLKVQMRKESNSPDAIILTGGGAEYYHDEAKLNFKDQVIIKQKKPVISNSKGFYYYGTTQ